MLAVMLTCSFAAHAEDVATVPAVASNREGIEQSVAQLRTDPNLGHTHTERRLRWDDGRETAEQPALHSFDWLLKFLDSITRVGRVLVWVAFAIIAGCIAIWIWRLVKTRQASHRRVIPHSLSHVQDLDIRPGSLPTDIGAAALAQLQAGNSRAALSLLYRGALSRAVHRFAVSIGASFTESEALRAVAARLDAGRSDYFAALVRLWQRTVYGAVEPPHTEVAALCTDFSGVFDAGPA